MSSEIGNRPLLKRLRDFLLLEDQEVPNKINVDQILGTVSLGELNSDDGNIDGTLVVYDSGDLTDLAGNTADAHSFADQLTPGAYRCDQLDIAIAFSVAGFAAFAGKPIGVRIYQFGVSGDPATEYTAYVGWPQFIVPAAVPATVPILWFSLYGGVQQNAFGASSSCSNWPGRIERTLNVNDGENTLASSIVSLDGTVFPAATSYRITGLFRRGNNDVVPRR